MADIIELLKIKEETLDLESSTIEAVIAYLMKIGVVSTNGNGHKEESGVDVPDGFIRTKGKGGSVYLRRKRQWFRKPIEAAVKRPVGRPRKIRKGK